MNTEKNSPVTANTFSKFLLSIKCRISEHRFALRVALNSRPLNLLTIVSILPIFLGFYNFINQNQQLKKTVFQKNIPTFCFPTETLNWETFRYFPETKTDFLVEIEKVEWSTNSLFLTKTLNKQLFDQEYFIASFNTTIDKNEKVLSISSETEFLNPIEYSCLIESDPIVAKNKMFFSNDIHNHNKESNGFYLNALIQQPALPILQTFYSNLDEVPLKLDNGFSYVNKNKSVFTIDKDISSTTQIFPFQETRWTKNIQMTPAIKKINSQDLLVESDGIKNQLPAINQFNTSTNSNKNTPNKSFLEEQTSWFLQKALNNCKITSGSLFSPSDEINKVEEILGDLILLQNDFSSYRRMSGYSYPDMNSKQVNGFLLHNLFSYFPKSFGITTQNNLKIIFPANPNFIKQFSFSNPKVPTRVDIKVATGTVKNWDNNETLYDDILVFVNLNNGLDWELKKTERGREKNLRFWFENYLSPQNPLTHSKDTIKGIAFTSRNFLVAQDYGDEYELVPLFTENDNKKILNKNWRSQLSLDDYLVNGNSLPVIQASLTDSKDHYARLNFSLNSTVDYLYSPQLFTAKIKPLSSLHGEFFNETFSPVHYKKIMSIFHHPQIIQKTFSESWEPLTFRSWLIVSQIGLAYLFFNFLKSIMSDYFNELIGFIIDLGLSTGIFDENIKEQIELVTGQRDKGFRIISKSKKKFQDIAGVKTLLPEIAELVWFLRNSGKEFSLSKNFPRGLLLLGPPGTGKTVLVQALAGEAKVPVLALSGSSLVAPGESGAVKLEFLFQEARQLAPCIVFIDEIDTLAQKRQGVMRNPMGGDEIFSALEPVNISLDLGQSTSKDFLENSQTSFFTKTDQIANLLTNSREFGLDGSSTSSTKQALEFKQKAHAQKKFQQEQLTLLIQLLIELDGIQSRKGVVVIGATNRPESLDPAILRPGRFDKILEIGLPSYEKRLEILKLYGGILGYDPNISWEYLSKRTVGFTAADLASLMNQSCLKAILNDTKHTLTTIEHGIDRITTSEIEKPSKKVTNFFRNRVAYYQAGKVVLSTILEHHPSVLVSYLWPRRQNRRSLQILTNLQKYFFQFARRCELEHRIVGCYGGKAAEILFLEKSPVNISSFGLEDLSFAFVLICFTIEKWYLYSKSTLIAELTQLISNKNSQEFIPEKIDFFKELAYSMEFSPHLLYAHETDVPTHPLSQNFFSSAWWQLHISKELEFVERNFSDWYRLYLPNPEETELNIEWSPPDEFYHRNLLNKKVETTSSITWNDLHNVLRDYQVHSFVLESFNKALSLLDENREYLDKLVFELLKREVLREPEIDKIASLFIPFSQSTVFSKTPFFESESEPTNQKIQNSSTQDSATIKILNNSFGEISRRKIKNWIDFKDFEN